VCAHIAYPATPFNPRPPSGDLVSFDLHLIEFWFAFTVVACGICPFQKLYSPRHQT
jgi:hypothetical protein